MNRKDATFVYKSTLSDLNVDSRILTGELFINDDYICEMLIKRWNEYPYFREEREAYIREDIGKMIAIVLSYI